LFKINPLDLSVSLIQADNVSGKISSTHRRRTSSMYFDDEWWMYY
jgi:hypothetical protein